MAGLNGTITITKSEYRTCLVKEQKALFHMWEEIDHSSKYLFNPAKGVEPIGEKFVVGIIEFENGQVTECYPYEIRFTDNKFNEYYFEEAE